MYEWDSITGKRTGEYVLKNCSYTGVGLSLDGKNIFAVGSDQKLKEITDSQASETRYFIFPSPFLSFKAIESNAFEININS